MSFLGTLPVEEWQIYQSELEQKAGVTWNRRDTEVRVAVRNEGRVESSHQARGSREANELHRV